MYLRFHYSLQYEYILHGFFNSTSMRPWFVYGLRPFGPSGLSLTGVSYNDLEDYFAQSN